ncbi:acyl-phosphate glycerol 3-phosphate acyltransferase [Lysinibacillus fusiformis]|uniref:acyl-phosphate glycerol 3-phosphate acyltransferase n=1 Tax=Lysinibacillus fusiformis TaxID=28031 RepID=UPI002D768EDC|nr:acyl-phosphate glycerol 3-phosphate acyltransferase [Lysinibacillus fusiformis]WRS97008.1 acyl-phosphate glycerol 3-phosphate acyltransferase [Lysinibacillus fusiformis]
MNQQKMPPALLRLIVIFPNVLSYLLLFGLIMFVITNYETLKATNNLTVWIILSSWHQLLHIRLLVL